MSEFLIKAFRIFVTLVLMAWTSYQLWPWFFSNGQPFVRDESVTVRVVDESELPVNQITYGLQTPLRVQNAAPARFVQIDTEGLPFSGHVE